MRLKLCVATLCAVASTPSYAACPASDKTFANKRFQGVAEVFSDGNLVGTWTLSQRFDKTGKVASGVVFKPDQPGEGSSYTATTDTFNKNAQNCAAEVSVISANGFNHSGRATFQDSGQTFEYVGTANDGTVVKVSATQQAKCQPAKAFANKAFACSFKLLDTGGNLITAWIGTQVFAADGVNSKASAFFVGSDERIDFDVLTTEYDPESCSGAATTSNEDPANNASGTFTMIPGKVMGWEYVGTILSSGLIAKSSCRLQ